MIKFNEYIRLQNIKMISRNALRLQIDRQNNRAKIKGINLIKKHVKTTKEKKGGIVSKESFIHISNLKLIDAKKANKKTEAKK